MKTDRPIILVTVPHTGTSFFRDLLRAHFAQRTYRDLFEGADGFCVMHVTEDTIADIAAIADPVLVTTTRDPGAVKLSYRRRGESLDALADYWKRWWDMVCQYKPYVVSVDSPRRDELLAELGGALGVEFATDWAPVNAWKGSEGPD